MKFDKSQDSSWNALVVYANSQCILADLKPQKNFYLNFILIIKTYIEFLEWFKALMGFVESSH